MIKQKAVLLPKNSKQLSKINIDFVSVVTFDLYLFQPIAHSNFDFNWCSSFELIQLLPEHKDLYLLLQKVITWFPSEIIEFGDQFWIRSIS